MRFLKRLTSGLDSVNYHVGRVFAWTVVPLTLLVTYEVVARRVFNAPHIWSFEITVMLYGFFFTIVAGYTLLRKGHVTIDIFSNRLPERTRLVVELAGYVLFLFPFMIVILVYGAEFAAKSWAMKEASETTFGPPLYPIKTIVPICAFLLLLQGLSDFIKRAYLLVKREEL